MSADAASIKHYYVDEAGDPVLFDSKGRVLVGTQGCSRYFAVGLLDVANPEGLAEDLNRLRAGLLADPYFKDVPSMRPEVRKKTALYFHAKDDLPEVRREMFKLLQGHALRFSAVVRDKQAVLDYVRPRNQRDPAYPTNEPVLQAVDYFLWALQRVFEKREDRFLELLWPQCSLVVDVDDTRTAEYGTYYTKQKPLKAAALKNG